MTMMTKASTTGFDELFARARAGDQAAWYELFQDCYPKLIRVIRRKMHLPSRSPYDTEDFASDVWKSLAAKMDRLNFQSVDSLVAFLTKCAHDKVVDERRRLLAGKRDVTRERPLTGDSTTGFGTHFLPSGDPTASQEAVASERLERIREPLTAEERRVIDLRRANYETDEIAVLVGWSLRKVQRFIRKLGHSCLESGGA